MTVGWAEPKLDREQALLIPVSLEETIPGDHPVRLYDEILRSLDWSDWEAAYDGRRGQPPIHPRVLCSAILYGLKRGIRSSRQLEDACQNRVDFMWLVECRVIDHSTFAKFRKRFAPQLKEVGKQVVHLAMEMGYVTLVEVATDGTLVKANNSRYAAKTKKTIEVLLAEVSEELEKALDEAARLDREEDTLFGVEASGRKLPKELQNLAQRQAHLQKALEEVEKVDAAKKRNGGKERKTPGQVPLTDVDSRVLQNKDGGFAPNYVPIATTDGEQGFVVDDDVINEGGEGAQQSKSLDRIEADLGKQPGTAMGDGSYGTSQNIVELEKREVELLAPVRSSEPGKDHPARREDPTQPVAEEKREALPLSPQTKKLDKTNFIYDKVEDCYRCPMGRKLPYDSTTTDRRASGDIRQKVYQCEDCGGCTLLEKCLSNPPTPRTVRRDVHQESIEKVAKRMETEEAQERYKRRSCIAETPFAFIKHIMGIRQFLLRGLENVRAEWRWICTAYNLDKLVRLIAATRSAGASVGVGRSAGTICTERAAM